MLVRIIVDNPNCNHSFLLAKLRFLWLQGTEIWRWLQPNDGAWWGIRNTQTKVFDRASEQRQQQLRRKNCESQQESRQQTALFLFFILYNTLSLWLKSQNGG